MKPRCMTIVFVLCTLCSCIAQQPGLLSDPADASPSSKTNTPKSSSLTLALLTEQGSQEQPEQGVYQLLETGAARWYGEAFHGQRTANGDIFSIHKLTAAHPKLPFGTQVRVINLHNKRSVIVKINDRGAFRDGHIIDLSKAAAERIGMLRRGVAKVRLEILENHSKM